MPTKDAEYHESEREWGGAKTATADAIGGRETGDSGSVDESRGVDSRGGGKIRSAFEPGQEMAAFIPNGALGNGSGPALLAVRIDESVRQTGSRSKAAERGIIHIELARARVSIEGTANSAAVRAVLECLAR